MSRKTYLTPQQQWERTVQYYLKLRQEEYQAFQEMLQENPEYNAAQHDSRDQWYEEYRLSLGEGIHLGQIVQAHKYFLRGDLVFIRISNGMARRHPVYAVSSKGYSIREYYLKYQSFWHNKTASVYLSRAAGPLRFVELPNDLVGRRPDDSAVWQFVATLRAEHAATG